MKRRAKLSRESRGTIAKSVRTLPPHRPERKCIGELDRRTLKGFAMHTDEQRRLFKLLADAYIHARYTKTYAITREKLEYLAGRVRKLRGIVDGVCTERLAP